MESFFVSGDVEQQTNETNNKLSIFELKAFNDREKMDNKEKTMTSSVGSILDDFTPSDSGVQLLDSESSELNISLMSNSGFDFDSGSCEITSKSISLTGDNRDADFSGTINSLPDLANHINDGLTKSDIANSNVCETINDIEQLQISDELISSTHSTFDTESIVYRRRAKKTKTHSSAPKKRVSFHEDILKNTKTDNIHIEHGFITYKSYLQKKNPQLGRYSWCSEGDTGDFNENNHVYRNACSDVLDYGKTEIYEDQQPSNYIHVDNSGVFEYGPHFKSNTTNEKSDFYKCNCSSSNSSLDSGSSQSDENNTTTTTTTGNNHNNYVQSKSNSCDCIGMTQNNNSNNNNQIITENCYYSEPSIEILNENNLMNKPKSVWSKDKKPKTSCLKKSKRHTDIILQEYDLNTKVKKFNVHPLSDMNNLIDNSKMIFGSLKNIFSIPLPERGVPEGSEDLQSVCECIPENDNFIQKQRTFLSKSLDGGFKDIDTKLNTKNYIHNVDEQLRRKNDNDLYAPTRNNSRDFVIVNNTNTNDINDDDDDDMVADDVVVDDNNVEQEFETIDKTMEPIFKQTDITPVLKPIEILSSSSTNNSNNYNYRNKFIINCESTVFEHTGVSYCFDENQQFNQKQQMQQNTNTTNKKSTFSVPLKQKLTNMFKTFTESNITLSSSTSTTPSTPSSITASTPSSINNFFKINTNIDVRKNENFNKTNKQQAKKLDDIKTILTPPPSTSDEVLPKIMDISFTSSCSDRESTISDLTTSTTTTNEQQQINSLNKIVIGTNNSPRRSNRHLASPARKNNNKIITSTSSGYCSGRYERNSRMSPDLFNTSLSVSSLMQQQNGRDLKNVLYSDDFDDIITITTTTDSDINDKNDSDMIIVDYNNDINNDSKDNNYLKPSTAAATSMSSSSTKSSLINRFLRNVTQKKIHDASIKKNNLLITKLKTEKKLFDNLYIKCGKIPINKNLIDDFNAEIAIEMKMSTQLNVKLSNDNLININDKQQHLQKQQNDQEIINNKFNLGVGEISIDIFNGNYSHILRCDEEILMKVFKLYTGYSKEGYMTPVIVFLTDKTLYVTDLVRNRLCNKFVLPYSDLDVILMGPYGNTVLLSNGSRDMQQVLLAGGPYPADCLVASLEMCARRGGSTLPAIGQLTLDHLAPLQSFVCNNSLISKKDKWIYYSVVNVPANSLNHDEEPLGPNVKGPLMHRNITQLYGGGAVNQSWHAGYFLLKAGVLYMFNDAAQKLPTWAVALAECQGARRSMTTGRPHCFELLLKTGILQLAAPDEYVSSEWLQALVQSASGLFEMQDKHLTLGCTLIMTENHLITLREDFSSPLRRINLITTSPIKENIDTNNLMSRSIMSNSLILDTISDISSITTSTTNISTPTRCSNSNMSTPTKFGQMLSYNSDEKSYTSMSSFYGKNSGVKILTCAALEQMIALKVPSQSDNWWCILEFSCQEVRENSDDLVIFFATNSELQRFMTILEKIWHSKHDEEFPISVINDGEYVGEHCSKLFTDLNKSWEPLISAVLGFPQ